MKLSKGFNYAVEAENLAQSRDDNRVLAPELEPPRPGSQPPPTTLPPPPPPPRITTAAPPPSINAPITTSSISFESQGGVEMTEEEEQMFGEILAPRTEPFRFNLIPPDRERGTKRKETQPPAEEPPVRKSPRRAEATWEEIMDILKRKKLPYSNGDFAKDVADMMEKLYHTKIHGEDPVETTKAIYFRWLKLLSFAINYSKNVEDAMLRDIIQKGMLIIMAFEREEEDQEFIELLIVHFEKAIRDLYLEGDESNLGVLEPFWEANPWPHFPEEGEEEVGSPHLGPPEEEGQVPPPAPPPPPQGRDELQEARENLVSRTYKILPLTKRNSESSVDLYWEPFLNINQPRFYKLVKSEDSQQLAIPLIIIEPQNRLGATVFYTIPRHRYERLLV